MPAFVELYIDQGTTFSATIELYDDANNIPMNLANINVSSQLRRSYYSANSSANLSCNVTNAAYGIITVSLSAAQTANIRAGRYVFDTKTTHTSGVVQRPIEGIVTVTSGVTR